MGDKGGRMHRGQEEIVWRAEFRLIETIKDIDSVEEAVFLVRDCLLLTHVTFHMAVRREGPVNYPYVRTTAPQWLSRYILKDYLLIDPVVHKGFATTEPFGCQDIPMDTEIEQFFADARAHGIGAHGYCFPTIDKYSRRSILSLSGNGPRETWLQFISQNFNMFIQMAEILHEKALGEISMPSATVTLAPREAECLIWTARGKDSKAIAAILGISEYTVRSYLRTARQKLECRTLSQAVAKAIQNGLIDS